MLKKAVKILMLILICAGIFISIANFSVKLSGEGDPIEPKIWEGVWVWSSGLQEYVCWCREYVDC